MRRGGPGARTSNSLMSFQTHRSSVSALERPSHQGTPQWLGTPAARGRLCHFSIFPQEGGELRAQVRHSNLNPQTLPPLCVRWRMFAWRRSRGGCREAQPCTRHSPAGLTRSDQHCSLSAVAAATCHQSASPRCVARTPAAAPHPPAAIAAPKRKGKHWGEVMSPKVGPEPQTDRRMDGEFRGKLRPRPRDHNLEWGELAQNAGTLLEVA